MKDSIVLDNIAPYAATVWIVLLGPLLIFSIHDYHMRASIYACGAVLLTILYAFQFGRQTARGIYSVYTYVPLGCWFLMAILFSFLP